MAIMIIIIIILLLLLLLIKQVEMAYCSMPTRHENVNPTFKTMLEKENHALNLESKPRNGLNLS